MGVCALLTTGLRAILPPHHTHTGGGSPSGELSPEDTALLSKYVTSGYLSEGNWGKVQAKFAEDGSVQLQNFLKPAWVAQVAQVRGGVVQRLGILGRLGGMWDACSGRVLLQGCRAVSLPLASGLRCRRAGGVGGRCG